MRELVEQNRREDDAHQRETAAGISLSVSGRLRHPDESQQKQESEMMRNSTPKTRPAGMDQLRIENAITPNHIL